MPCADRVRRGPGAGPNGHARPVPPRARRLCPAAGFAAAPDQRQYRRYRRSRCQAPRQGQARAVADRPDPDLRPARRQRRLRHRIRFAQSHTQKADALSGPGQAEARTRSRQSGAGGLGGTADVERPDPAVDSAVRDRQQDADSARDGRHGGGPAAAQTAEGRRRSVRRGRRLRRQLSDQVGGRTFGRLRHQSGPHLRAEGIAVLCGGAGIPGRLQLGASRAGRRLARIVHRLWQHLPAADRRHHLLGADRSRPAGFHRPCRRPPRRQPTTPG